ncbi:MAG: lytic murein transglycosylase [Candidatus Delongbacteria bacterium]|nr:lytic murein transglycosylase [Candidatus Delongbacteria bacterium]MCG2760953.1 lytic murein transglycosylase [Candidatus Delongbacteria bacterium]
MKKDFFKIFILILILFPANIIAQELRDISIQKPKLLYEQRDIYLAKLRNDLNSKLYELSVDKNNLDEIIEKIYYETLNYNIYKYRLQDVLDTTGALDYTKTDLASSDYFNNRVSIWSDSSLVEYITFRVELNLIKKYFSEFNLRDFKYSQVYKALKKRVLNDSLSLDEFDNALEKIQKIGFDPLHFYYKPNSIKEQLIIDKFDIKKFNFSEMIEFLKEHKEILDKTESKYKVNKEIIVAILRKETNLGRVPLKYNPFEVLLGQALFSIENPATDLKQRSNNLKRIARLQSSAVNSLYHIIKFCIENSHEPEGMKSNLVGAIGYTQFMPFNLYLAKDGNNDGVADLMNMDDSIMSIGNFLNRNGWDKFYDIKPKNKKAIIKYILKYNSSDTYAESVYEIAYELKKRMK